MKTERILKLYCCFIAPAKLTSFPRHSFARAVVEVVRMFQPKDPAARKFVKQFDKFTIVLCGTAAIAYGLQRYYVSAP